MEKNFSAFRVEEKTKLSQKVNKVYASSFTQIEIENKWIQGQNVELKNCFENVRKGFIAMSIKWHQSNSISGWFGPPGLI